MKKVLGYMWLGIFFIITVIMLFLVGWVVINYKTILGFEEVTLVHFGIALIFGLALFGCLVMLGYHLLQIIITISFPDKFEKIFKEPIED